MQIKGIVDSIVFRNDENGYTVFDFDAGGELATCVGSFAYVSVGEQLELTGDYTKNTRYGEQFSVKSYNSLGHGSVESIIRYLGSGLIKGVGPALAERIVRHFGKDTLSIIEFSPSRLREVRGISSDGAARIGVEFENIKKMKDAVMFLQGYDISVNLAMRIFDCYKEKTQEMVSKNPYQLVEVVDGIGFLTADRIACKLGIKENSPFRMRAGILHTLKQVVQNNGSTYMLKNNLFEQVTTLLELDAFAIFENALTELKLDGTVKTFFVQDESGSSSGESGEVMQLAAVALMTLYKTEQSIAAKLTLMNSGASERKNYDEQIVVFEKMNKIVFHEKQKEAIETALSFGVSVITGGPGTGKTTIVKCINSILTNEQKTILCLAPTGRASKRLSDSVGVEAKTIHRGLGAEGASGRAFFTHNENNKLEHDVVIVDEVSMIDCSLMSHLLKALKPNCKLILVGDHNQLPSVGAGNVLCDIIESECFDVVHLSQIYRQSENSMIAKNAFMINAGEMPDLNNKSDDFFFEKREDSEDVAAAVVELVSTRLPKFLRLAPQNIQVLAPMKVGKAGVEALNAALQKTLNPPKFGAKDIEFERVIFRLGDKVMQTQNNYDLEWKRQEKDQEIDGKGVFNGDIGTIIELNAQTGYLTIEFDDGRIARYSRADLANVTLAYAVTVHKSQGCEFDVVVMPVVMGAPLIFTRNLLYTAVTRAKKLVVLVGTKMAISKMIRNNYVEKRDSNLRAFLKEKRAEFEKLYG